MRPETIDTLRARVRFAAVVAAMLWSAAAWAADPIFPVGSRIGLVPPPGMTPAQGFNGFADPNRNAAILLVAFPPIAFDQLDKSMTPEELKKQGIDVAEREPMTFAFGKGFLVRAKQNTDRGRYRKWLLVAAGSDLTALVTVQAPEGDTAYTDKVLSDALSTLTVRASIPDAENLSLLPFTVGDFAGFRIDNVLPGSALMLVEADTASSQRGHFLIAALQGGPAEDKDRNDFAEKAFHDIGGLKDVQIQDVERLRINGQPGYETLANAKDPPTNDDLKVVQWLVFGNGSYIQMIGVVPASRWADLFPRLRTVRDSVTPK